MVTARLCFERNILGSGLQIFREKVTCEDYKRSFDRTFERYTMFYGEWSTRNCGFLC